LIEARIEERVKAMVGLSYGVNIPFSLQKIYDEEQHLSRKIRRDVFIIPLVTLKVLDHDCEKNPDSG
jgi:hypothetical protein